MKIETKEYINKPPVVAIATFDDVVKAMGKKKELEYLRRTFKKVSAKKIEVIDPMNDLADMPNMPGMEGMDIPKPEPMVEELTADQVLIIDEKNTFVRVMDVKFVDETYQLAE